MVGRANHLSLIQGSVGLLKFNKQVIRWLNCLNVSQALSSTRLAEYLI
jgi:hypothetical protein